MTRLKRIGLYGISGVGKTTLLQAIDLSQVQTIWLEGSRLVLESANLDLSEFKQLPESEKIYHRECAIAKAFDIQIEAQKHIMIDGHLAFAKGPQNFENVMTQADCRFYTDFIYMELPPSIVFERQQGDVTRIRSFSVETITAWIEYEKQALKKASLEMGANYYSLTEVSLQAGKKIIVDIINS